MSYLYNVYVPVTGEETCINTAYRKKTAEGNWASKSKKKDGKKMTEKS
jgi:hypothetical protein